LIDTFIIFEILANVNRLREGEVKMYQKYVALRDKAGITDYRVSKETGIPTSALTNWKYGRYAPKFDKLLTLAKYFNVPVEYFADEE